MGYIFPRKFDRKKIVKTITILNGTSINLEIPTTHQISWELLSNPILIEVGVIEAVEITNRTPAFISTNTAVATVNSSGLVTPVATGNCDILVTIDNEQAIVHIVVTNPQSQVATVEIVEGTGTIAITTGNSATRQARAKDASGNVLNGKTITWPELTGASLITVSADSGDENHQVSITGDAAGTATFRASCEGVNSATLTVNVSDANPSHPNEPAGYTQLINFSCGTLSGWFNLTNFEVVTVETDASAPASPSDIIQLEWPVGTQSGGVPGRDFVFNPRLRELYVSYWFKVLSPYTKHPSGTEKILLIGTNGPEPGSASKRNEIITAWHGGSTSSTRILHSIQVPAQTSPDGMTTNAYYDSNINGAFNLVPVNTWHHVEIVIKMNTAGVKDGQIRWWIDGNEIGNHDQLWFNTTLRGEVTAIRFQWYRGGTGALTFSIAEHVLLDNLYASGITY